MNINVTEVDRDHEITRRVNSDLIESVVVSPKGSIIVFASGSTVTVKESPEFILSNGEENAQQ